MIFIKPSQTFKGQVRYWHGLAWNMRWHQCMGTSCGSPASARLGQVTLSLLFCFAPTAHLYTGSMCDDLVQSRNQKQRLSLRRLEGCFSAGMKLCQEHHCRRIHRLTPSRLEMDALVVLVNVDLHWLLLANDATSRCACANYRRCEGYRAGHMCSLQQGCHQHLAVISLQIEMQLGYVWYSSP